MTCSVENCTQPVTCKGMCRRHYDRERDRKRHRHRDDALLRTRARNRAVARLIDAHPDEFADLFAEERAAAEREADELAEAAQATVHGPRPDVRTSVAEHVRTSVATSSTSSRRPVRLLTGPRPVDQRTVDRIRADVGRCTQCQSFHDRGHRCAQCGSTPRESTA